MEEGDFHPVEKQLSATRVAIKTNARGGFETDGKAAEASEEEKKKEKGKTASGDRVAMEARGMRD